jgi:hypothetical protein
MNDDVFTEHQRGRKVFRRMAKGLSMELGSIYVTQPQLETFLAVEHGDGVPITDAHDAGGEIEGEDGGRLYEEEY